MQPLLRVGAALGQLACLFAALACGGSPPTAPDDGSHIDPAEVERLRALGYVGVGQALPPDAPIGVLRHDRERAAPGLNLITNAHFCSAQLLDMDGEILHSWSHQPCYRWGNAVLAPNGDLLAMGRLPHDDNPDAAREARYLERLDWNGKLLWRKSMSAHHDVDVAPDGRILTLDYELRVMPERDRATPVRDNALVVLGPDGELQERVSLLDLLATAPDLFTLEETDTRHFEGGRELDPLHANAVEWMREIQLIGQQPIYRASAVLVCIRNQDTLAIFDWEAKRLLWAWGRGEISGPHDATLLPNGNILAFDNGLGRDWSRVIELDPIARRIVWEYRASDPTQFYSATRGSNQRLSNGNTLIAESDAGRVIEVDPAGDVVWELLNPNITDKREPSVVVRARRFEGVTYDELARRVTAGDGLPFRVD